MTNKSIQAYPLPDDPDPQIYTCHRVYLPAGKGFERAFFGSLSHLSKWVAWARDDDHNAVLAADSMKVANNMTLAEWATSAGCTEPQPPPYTDDLPDGRTPEEGTIDDWLWPIFEVTVLIDTLIGEGKTETQIIEIMVPIWQAKTGSGGTSVIVSMTETMLAISQAERDTLTDPAGWLQVRDGAVCTVTETCPSLFTISSPGGFYDWLNCSASNIYDYLNSQSGLIFDLLNESAAILEGTEAVNTIVNADGGGAGFGFGAAVCWEHVFDFTVSAEGWLVVLTSDDPWTQPPKGTITGSGWSTQATTIVGHDGQFVNHCLIRFPMPGGGATVTSMQMDVVLGGQANNVFDGGWRLSAWDDVGGREIDQDISYPVPAGAYSKTMSITNGITTELWCGLTFCNSDVGQSWITKVTIKGLGADPFA